MGGVYVLARPMGDPFSEGMWLQQVMLKLAKMAAKISDELRV
jgi:hypothetical protein